jgi:hypothetical protein
MPMLPRPTPPARPKFRPQLDTLDDRSTPGSLLDGLFAGALLGPFGLLSDGPLGFGEPPDLSAPPPEGHAHPGSDDEPDGLTHWLPIPLAEPEPVRDITNEPLDHGSASAGLRDVFADFWAGFGVSAPPTGLSGSLIALSRPSAVPDGVHPHLRS